MLRKTGGPVTSARVYQKGSWPAAGRAPPCAKIGVWRHKKDGWRVSLGTTSPARCFVGTARQNPSSFRKPQVGSERQRFPDERPPLSAPPFVAHAVRGDGSAAIERLTRVMTRADHFGLSAVIAVRPDTVPSSSRLSGASKERFERAAQERLPSPFGF